MWVYGGGTLHRGRIKMYTWRTCVGEWCRGHGTLSAFLRKLEPGFGLRRRIRMCCNGWSRPHVIMEVRKGLGRDVHMHVHVVRAGRGRLNYLHGGRSEGIAPCCRRRGRLVVPQACFAIPRLFLVVHGGTRKRVKVEIL